MPQFRVSDMTCSGCVKAITGAVQDLDAAATVDANLDTKQVAIASTVPAAALAEAMRDAGFTVACFPVKIRGASAGWTRAVAIFDD